MLQCGCPEHFVGGWCAACHGTGRIPPVPHPPIRRLPWSEEIACAGDHPIIIREKKGMKK